MRRLPLRLRLVAGFSAAMLVVLVAAAGFVYWRVEYALDRGLDGELQRATAALEGAATPDGTLVDDRAIDATGAAYQVVDGSGRVLAHGDTAGRSALVERSQLPPPGGSPTTVNVGPLLPVSDRPLRVRVTPTEVGGQVLYLVVGVRRDHRDEALRELLAQLSLAVLGALVVTSAVGYLLARSALAPVERYRRRAETIAAGVAGLRLDVPTRRDDEVVRLGHTLNEMLAALERAVETERRFLDEASHELRTPLTLLKSRVQAAQRRSRTVTEHEAILAELLVDVDRLARLASQLLALRSAVPGSATTDVGAVAVRVARRHEVEAQRDGTAEATVAEDVVERIAENLVTNALVHGNAPVVVRAGRAGDCAALTVTDAGPGMDAAMLDRATHRFARADDARSRPGSGLGLAIVRHLTESAGGQLRLCSGGEHRRFGNDVPLPCVHDPARMTVTVLLPARCAADDYDDAPVGTPSEGSS